MMNYQTVFVAVLFCQCVHGSDIESSLTRHLTDELVATLPGVWDGVATETPVGPVEYAIVFYRCGEGIVAGVSTLRVSNHYWRFWKSDGDLHLTFLSTFGGNRDPTQLVSNKTRDNKIWFYAPELALLTLSVTMDEPNIDIHIFHHHKSHVYIRLTRANEPMIEIEQKVNHKESCRQL